MQMTPANASTWPRQHEQPLAAGSTAPSAQPTILRIRRRKRDDHETLDALVIADGRQNSNRPVKRSRQAGSSESEFASKSALASSKGVFRFLETVPTSAFSSEDSKRSLRDRVTSLLLHPPPRQSSSSNLASKSPRAAIPSRSAPSSNLLLGSGRQSKLSAPPSPSSSRAGSIRIQEKARRHARYKIIQEKRSMSSLVEPATRNVHADFPPTIRSTAKTSETPSVASSATDDIKILEAAVESDSDSEVGSNDPISRKLQAYSKARRRQDPLKSESWQSSSSNLARELTFPNPNDSSDGPSQGKEDDDMMMNFVPMLQEYLSLNRPSTPETTSNPPDGSNDVSPPHPGFGSAHDLSSGDAADSDSEWVYDVYYRDVGTTAASFSTSHDGVDIGGVGGFERIAALTGLNEDEVLLGEGEGEEDSDVPNTDDEDSNEEDFYRNDYPEGDEDASDENADSDMSQSDSDYD